MCFLLRQFCTPLKAILSVQQLNFINFLNCNFPNEFCISQLYWLKGCQYLCSVVNLGHSPGCEEEMPVFPCIKRPQFAVLARIMPGILPILAGQFHLVLVLLPLSPTLHLLLVLLRMAGNGVTDFSFPWCPGFSTGSQQPGKPLDLGHGLVPCQSTYNFLPEITVC